MARAGIMKTKLLLLDRQVEVKPVGRCISKLARSNYKRKTKGSVEGGDMVQQEHNGPLGWLPHPRTGIYFPKGHESVMDDVPTDAACFDRTYWLRNIEGVDRPDLPDNLQQ
ncbi:hypothetical protein Adt_17695 [Abeliophyllum distichum]|uniref:Uncharacterized protein n=1 Tax=Abeliophyllum distichum TaxID=126358 RepID=A0ABD1THA6_9LAMI